MLAGLGRRINSPVLWNKRLRTVFITAPNKPYIQLDKMSNFPLPVSLTPVLITLSLRLFSVLLTGSSFQTYLA